MSETRTVPAVSLVRLGYRTMGDLARLRRIYRATEEGAAIPASSVIPPPIAWETDAFGHGLQLHVVDGQRRISALVEVAGIDAMMETIVVTSLAEAVAEMRKQQPDLARPMSLMEQLRRLRVLLDLDAPNFAVERAESAARAAQARKTGKSTAAPPPSFTRQESDLTGLWGMSPTRVTQALNLMRKLGNPNTQQAAELAVYLIESGEGWGPVMARLVPHHPAYLGNATPGRDEITNTLDRFVASIPGTLAALDPLALGADLDLPSATAARYLEALGPLKRTLAILTTRLKEAQL